MRASSGGLVLLVAVISFVIAAALFQLALLWTAGRRRKRFYASLGSVVRIATPCRIVTGKALVPGSVGLTPKGLAWQGLAGVSGMVPFDEIQRLETDRTLRSGRKLLRSEALRVTKTSGDVLELVLAKGDAWEWHRAIGEWVGRQGKLDMAPDSFA